MINQLNYQLLLLLYCIMYICRSVEHCTCVEPYREIMHIFYLKYFPTNALFLHVSKELGLQWAQLVL